MADPASGIQSDVGSVTAEFTVVLPAVFGLLTISLGVISGQVQAAKLQQVAAVASHALARAEDPEKVRTWLRRQAPGSNLESSSSEGVLCASVEQPFKFVFAVEDFLLKETSCAWVGIEVSDE